MNEIVLKFIIRPILVLGFYGYCLFVRANFLGFKLPHEYIHSCCIGCLLLAAWFFFIINSGILENPKPNQTPLDSAKPLLWIQSITALLTGLFLLYIASRQRRICISFKKNEFDMARFLVCFTGQLPSYLYP